MDYINLLTTEEKLKICDLISGKEFKELFKGRPDQLSKIRKGFRVPKAIDIKESFALDTAKENIDVPFIKNFINYWIEKHLNKIKYVNLATSLLKSKFAENIDLYLKLTGKNTDEELIVELNKHVDIIKSKQKKEKEEKNNTDTLNEENKKLVDLLKESNLRILENQKSHDDEKKKLNQLLKSAQKKVIELQTPLTEFTTNEDPKYLAQKDDTNTTVLHEINNDKTFSLCGTYVENDGSKKLIRYADLTIDGHYNIFHKDKGQSPYFQNRDWLFYKEGPTDNNFYGVWSWTATPNLTNPSKDYVVSQFHNNIIPIEVVIISSASNLDELVALLKNKIEYRQHSTKILFAVYTSNERYTGILCTDKNINHDNGLISFNKDCIDVPIYNFNYNDILYLNNGLCFYKNTFAGIPDKIYYLKTPLEIVKDIISSKLTWSICKNRITHAELDKIKSFLDALPNNNIIQEIEKKCRCSNFAAQELLNQFMKNADKCIEGETIEDEILFSTIKVNKELQEKAKQIIRTEWEQENKTEINQIQNKLSTLKAEIVDTSNKLTKVKGVFEQTKVADQQLNSYIAQKQKLAEDVDKAVDEKITNAQKNVADFIAQMAFVRNIHVQNSSKSVDSDNEPSKFSFASYQTVSGCEDLDETDKHHSWVDAIISTSSELVGAGVSRQYSLGLAAFLCAAYIIKQPILLVGPNAIDIIKAFSASIKSHQHGTLYCDGAYTNQTIEKIGSQGEDIVIINNLLTSQWINRIPELFSKRDIFFVATHPYAEDIQVEPKSLYEFMLPLFTEFFVDKKASGKYYGGFISEDLQAYKAPSIVRKKIKILSEFALSALTKNQINLIVSTMHDIYSDTSTDDEFLFSILPIAFATQSVNKLSDTMTNPEYDLAISSSLRQDLQYILGEE